MVRTAPYRASEIGAQLLSQSTTLIALIMILGITALLPALFAQPGKP